jgi:small redox-active disulfide protein 2
MNDIRQIVVAGSKVGLSGLQGVFEQVSGESPGTDQELGERLLQLAAQNNYIPSNRKQEYREALLREYRRYRGERIPEESVGLEIKVFGVEGCSRCSKFADEIMAVLAELDISADLEHVRDITRFAELGPVAPPVLMINGKMISSGRVPRREEIAKILREVSS